MDDFKSYATRTLVTENTQYKNVIWQAGKPPLDSELNLMGQLASQNQASLVRSQAHSGVLIDPRSADRDYSFEKTWSNYFRLKPFSALVNGNLVNVEDLDIKLPPPPESGSRTDFVFLEVWNTIISAEGSGVVDNKPSPTTIYQNGNVDGQTTLDDELVDGQVGFETTKRVQTQYQVRVVSGVDLKSHPEGLSSPLVTAVGPTDGLANEPFSNVSGDAGLWSASVSDVYLSENTIYAIPLCSVFRRNEEPYKDVANAGGPNQNGSVNRKPSSTSTSDATSLVQSSLTNDVTRDQVGNVTLTNLVGSGLDDSDLFPANTSRFFVLGQGINREVVKVSSVDTLNNRMVIEERGVAGTQAKYHASSTSVSLFNPRPDSKYADEVHSEDVLDMRHATTLGEWDYQSLLESSVTDLLFGRLKTTYKQNSVNAFSKGTVVEEVSYLSSVASNRTHQMDYPNGYRDTWSDASYPQMGLTLYLNPSVATDNAGLSTENLDVSNQNSWEIGPDLSPSAFLFDAVPMQTGSILFLTLDGALDNLGYGVKGNTIQDKGIRFIAPSEIGTLDQTKRPPFMIEQLGAEHTNLTYPTFESNFEKPFIVLGRLRGTETFTTSTAGQDRNNHNFAVIYKKTAFSDSEMSVIQGTVNTEFDEVLALQLNSIPLTQEDINLIEPYNSSVMTGEDSNLYALVYGDPTNGSRANGVFKVISVSNNFSADDYYLDAVKTPWNPSAGVANTVILQPIDDKGVRLGLIADGLDLRVEFRSQRITELDDSIAIAVTSSDQASNSLYTQSEFQLSVSILYPPALGATANVPSNIHKVGITPPNRDHFLRNALSDLDSTNSSALPLISGEIDLPTKNHISLWNRLPSSNLPTGWTSNLGGRIINEESDRESEVFKDEGSKTLVLRPYQKKQVILHQHEEVADQIPTTYSNGVTLIDGGDLFVKKGVYTLPEALVPRFGRQDIPMHNRTSSSDSFLTGLNHVFADKVAVSDEVFNIVGGVSNVGNQSVEPILFDTLGNYGEYAQSLATVNAIGVRKREDGGILVDRTSPLNVPTSDFGTTLQGIELPPYYGVARIYGVYDRDAYIAHIVGNGNTSGHNSERVLPIDALTNGLCPNLLRTDTSDFTLYINQNGGNDDVGDPAFVNAHTYVLTEHAIDITRSPNYTDTKTFKDFEYVVEAVVFGFADGFITENRNVLLRKYNGAGILRNAGDTSKITVDSVIPFAPPQGSRVAVAYKRTVYQGNPFFTKGVNILDDSDQTLTYGRKSVNDLQLGSRDQNTVEFLNRRNLQVLASMDFYTTLGTGKLGGEVYPTTVTDINHTDHKPFRNPAEYTGTYPSTKTSTFTQVAQRGGYATIFLFNNPAIINDYLAVTLTFSNTRESFTFPFAGYGDVSIMGIELINFLQDKGYELSQVTGSYTHDGASHNYYGILIREPYENYNTVISIDTQISGRDLQLFEGIREVPMSFNFYDSIVIDSRESEYGLPSRTKTSVSFSKPSYNPTNAGDGTTPISLVGLTSRLPLGSLVRDSDFVCEDILNNQSSYLLSSTGNISTLSNSVPVNPEGKPYSRSVGVSGDVLQMTEGDLSQSTPLAESNNYYSISRGSGAVFGSSGEVAGSPFSFLTVSLNESTKPVLKGSVLACRAMLVKNFHEEFQGNVRSYGDELQLLVVTHCIDGASRSPLTANTSSSQLTIGGEISPTGYGEGFASADRYRIKGRPLLKSHSNEADLNIKPAPFNSK